MIKSANFLHILDDYVDQCRQPNIFSRGALQDTFRLLRPTDPSLALVIQNILNSEPVTKPEGFDGDQRTDCYAFDMEVEQIQAIIAALTVQASAPSLKKIRSNVTALGNLVILKSLLEDWLDYARIFIETTANSEAPSLKVAS